jgi:hypothetical protein
MTDGKWKTAEGACTNEKNGDKTPSLSLSVSAFLFIFWLRPVSRRRGDLRPQLSAFPLSAFALGFASRYLRSPRRSPVQLFRFQFLSFSAFQFLSFCPRLRLTLLACGPSRLRSVPVQNFSFSAFQHFPLPSSIRHQSSAREGETTSPGHLPSATTYRLRNFAYFFRSAGVNGTAPCLRMIASNSATVKIPDALAGAET